MKIRVRPRSRNHIVCPIRFYRVVEGPEFPSNDPEADKPEVDDRAFRMGSRPVKTWSSQVDRGAMVGMAVHDIVEVKVRFEDLDHTLELDGPNIPIFVTSTDPSLVKVVAPKGGGPLDFDGVFRIQGLQDVVRGQVTIQARLGSDKGPVLGQLEPHIFTLLRLRLRLHLVTITSEKSQTDGKTTDHTASGFRKLVEEANKIWRPAGIEFVFRESQKLEFTIPLSTAGQVTTFEEKAPDRLREVRKVFKKQPDANAINVYGVHKIVDLKKEGDDREKTLGGTLRDKDIGEGILLVDLARGGNGRTLAHELGHYLLGLGHADFDSQGKKIRDDHWAIRRLMYTRSAGPDEPPHRNNVGWGEKRAGVLLTMKHLEKDPEDGEVPRARREARKDRALAPSV